MTSSQIKIVEVGPRDGLQNIAADVPTPIKIELINRLGTAGLRYIEATSFVSPKRVPQLADHNAVMRGIKRRDDVTYSALVPNAKGMEAAIAAGVREVAVFTAATNSFTQANIGCTIAESFERFAPVMTMARAHNIKVRGYVSCAVACPYDGPVAPDRVADVAAKLATLGCFEISLGDTIGVGTPDKILVLLKAQSIPLNQIALHLHDTYGQAIANIYTGLEAGCRIFDSSIAGLGGCPYAPGASGNVATEDVVYLMNGLGMKTGIDLGAMVDTAWFISDALGKLPASRVALARRGQCP